MLFSGHIVPNTVLILKGTHEKSYSLLAGVYNHITQKVGKSLQNETDDDISHERAPDSDELRFS